MSHRLVSLSIGDGEYYTRTDADAVIAELKADYQEACDRLQTANLIKDEQLAATRHHKFKRCLAMAEWCNANYFRQYMFKPNFWKRWHNSWLELAEKFKDKEAK
jgi:hypothetical protein